VTGKGRQAGEIMKKFLVFVFCFSLVSCFQQGKFQKWKLVNQEDSFGEETGEQFLIGTFRSKGKTLLIVVQTFNGKSCSFSFFEGRLKLPLSDPSVKVRTQSETLMLAMYDSFVSHGSASARDDFITEFNSVDRIGYFKDFLDILNGGQNFKISIETDLGSGVFDIDVVDFSKFYNEMLAASDYTDEESAYTDFQSDQPQYSMFDIPVIRAITKDRSPYYVDVEPVLEYELNTDATAELTSRSEELKDFIRTYFSNKSNADMEAEKEYLLKEDLVEQLNLFLNTAKVRRVLFMQLSTWEK
jgi:flagellar basal body-associated protein FliL